MAHYETSVTSPLAPADAFAKMAEMTNFAEWDPGVQSAEQVAGTEPGLNAAYKLVVNGVGPAPAIPLKYVMKEFSDGKSFRALAKAKFFSSDDRISVTPEGSGSVVKYEADLLLNGPLKVLDPLLKPIFQKIGSDADEGLKKFLN